MPDIRNFVGFAQTETLVKEYDGLRMYSPVRAKIGIAVTTKRLIAYSNVRSFFDQRSESLYQQVSIAEIKGIGVVQSSRYRPGLMAGGIVLLIIGIALAVIGLSGKSILLFGGIGVVVLGIALAVTGALWKKPVFRFEIWGNSWVHSLGEFENTRSSVAAGPDLLKVVEELGALVIEVQEGTLYSGQ
jgi:hypothetical protein